MSPIFSQLALLATPGLVDIKRSDWSIFNTEHTRRIETFQSALTVSTSLRLPAGPRAFLTARPGAWPCPMTGPRRSASPWHSPLRAAADVSSPRASAPHIFAPVVEGRVRNSCLAADFTDRRSVLCLFQKRTRSALLKTSRPLWNSPLLPNRNHKWKFQSQVAKFDGGTSPP